MADQEPTDTSEPVDNAQAEPEQPLNRAARRALRRGKNAASWSVPAPAVTVPGPRNQVVAIRRRAGRRGNR